MEKPKHYTRKKTFDGVEYTAQFNGISAALDATDESQNDSGHGVSSKKLTNYVLENVIVDPPGLTPDDFEDMETLSAVIKWGSQVMQGKFREKTDQSTAKKQG
ncbi:hypothetical protein LJC49_04480 [Ruminococcaceae bacterium OttesenSCG-928-I18]|nr:hypothetical protein [Ruminococcaceae bacterium OttesenSCG-928-I18]